MCRCAFVAAAFCLAQAAPRTYTYPQLVQRVYDLQQLVHAPKPGEKSGCVSSFDRASRYNEQTGLYENWFANSDGGGHIRKEGEDTVMAELEGPGVIWRIWSARATQGHVQFFIDGAQTPVIDMPFERLFDNTKEPFAYSNLNRTMARGLNFFIPIPYQKSCKIVLKKGWGNYFQCTYTRFPEGTRVPSFDGRFSQADRAALEKAQAIIAQRGGAPAQEKSFQKTISVPAGKTTVLADIAGAGLITQIELTAPALEPEQLQRALRELTVAIYWDGEAAPSVWAPLGDFFGSGFGANVYQSLAAGFDGGKFYCRWPMPFAKGARVVIGNDADKAHALSFRISTGEPPENPAKLLRFHAKWHRNHFGKDPQRYFADRWPDWPLLLLDGAQGRFCGVSLHIWNPFHVWNKDHKNKYEAKLPPVNVELPEKIQTELLTRWWWGEGDEKFFVDGEKFPSTFGTGSEDYFGYAWGTPAVFDSHSQNQPRNADNIGHIVVSRWHIADNVPFQKSFEAAIEKYHGDNWPLLYAATAFWYQKAGTADDYDARPLSDRLDYLTQPVVKPDYRQETGSAFGNDIAARARIECENLKPLNVQGDIRFSTQRMDPWDAQRWSEGAQLLGKGKRAAAFTLEIPAPDAQPKRLRLYATKASDYGMLSFEVNGQKSEADFDGYAGKVIPSGAFTLGVFTPQNGKFSIRVTLAGANEKVTGDTLLLGLDMISISEP